MPAAAARTAPRAARPAPRDAGSGAARSARPDAQPAPRHARPAPRLRVVARPSGRLRLGWVALAAIALSLVGIIWIGLAQLRLTTKTGAVDHERRVVEATIQDLNARLAQRNGEIRAWATDHGMVDASPGTTVWIR